MTRFDDAAMASIRDALRAFGSRQPASRRAPLGKVSEPTFERFTSVLGGVPRTTVSPGGARPPALAQVLERIERAGQSA